MANYYGVQRSEEYLEHYGIKGMRWGVRKAIESGNDRRLERQYKKAQKRLQKLNLRADVDIQKTYAKKHAKRAAVAASVGLSGVGLGVLNQINIRNRIKQIAKENPNLINQLPESTVSSLGITKPTGSAPSGPHFRTRKKTVIGEGKDFKKVGEGLGYSSTQNVGSTPLVGYKHPSAYPNQTITTTNLPDGTSYGTLHTHLYEDHKQPTTITGKSGTYSRIRNASELIGLAGLGTAAYQVGKAISAKYRTTKKGHAKAVAKRDAWKKSMQEAFKGTKFDGGNRHKNNKRKRK